MILLDASVFLAAEQSTEAHHESSVRLLTSGLPLATLDLAALEVVNVALWKWADEETAETLRARVFAVERFGKLIRVDEKLVERSEAIAIEHRISAYDAGYVAAAERSGATLVSCDEADLVSKDLAQFPGDLLD